MKFIYHYCAETQGTVMDGLITREVPLRTMGDYTSVKQAIRKQFEVPPHQPITITSLSLLSTEET